MADKLCPCFATKISIEPTKVEYGPTNETAYCDRLKVFGLFILIFDYVDIIINTFYFLQYNIYRQKPTKCFNYHAEETEIKLCGGAGRLVTSLSGLQASHIPFRILVYAITPNYNGKVACSEIISK